MVKAQPTSTSSSSLQLKIHQQSKKENFSGNKKNKKKEIVIPNFAEEDPAEQQQEQQEKKVVNKKKNNNNDTSVSVVEEQGSRKEQRKQILAQRLEKKLKALEKLHEQNKLTDNTALTGVLGKPKNIFVDDDDDDAEDEEDDDDDEEQDDQNEDGAESNNDDDQDDEDNINNKDGAEKKQQAKKSGSDNEDEEKGEEDDDNNNAQRQQMKQVAAAAAAPRKASLGGTYWKERKEKRSRTLFVGGLPGAAGLGLVRRLLNQYGADNKVQDPKQEIEVDFIKPKNQQAASFRKQDHSLPKNAYCVLPTKELAERVANSLDGVWVHPDEITPMTDRDATDFKRQHNGAKKPSKLRVNFADDPNQRNVAISKRKGGDGNREAYYKNNKGKKIYPGTFQKGGAGGGGGGNFRNKFAKKSP
jgi:hypothetical protein